MSVEYDVAVVGSGIAGLTSAYRLANDHEVLVLDRDAIGQGTSSRASGLITPTLDYPDLPQWCERAVETFRSLDGTGVFEFDERPYIRLVRDEAGAETARTRDDATLLSVEEARERFGEVFVDREDLLGIAVYDHVGICDVSAFLSTLKRECEREGVHFRPDTAVTDLRVAGGRVTGVDTEFGPVDADHVVAATGSATPDLLDDHVRLPIRPFLWNAVYLDVARDVSKWPVGGDSDHRIYWRPTQDGSLLVGRENPAFGRDTGIDPAFERLVAEDLPELLSVGDPDVRRWEKCPMADATTPDGQAIIDAVGPDGLVVAAGFHGAGVMCGFAIGDAVRSLVTGEDCDVEAGAFSLDRFDSRSRAFSFQSLFG